MTEQSILQLSKRKRELLVELDQLKAREDRMRRNVKDSVGSKYAHLCEYPAAKLRECISEHTEYAQAAQNVYDIIYSEAEAAEEAEAEKSEKSESPDTTEEDENEEEEETPRKRRDVSDHTDGGFSTCYCKQCLARPVAEIPSKLPYGWNGAKRSAPKTK